MPSKAAVSERLPIRRGLSEAEAALYIGVGSTKFRELVEERESPAGQTQPAGVSQLEHCRLRVSDAAPRRKTKIDTKARAHQMQGLFPCEAEIARRLSQTEAEWAAKSIILERDGLPKIDPIMGGRYWPAVVAYLHRRYGLGGSPVFQPDGEENLNEL